MIRATAHNGMLMVIMILVLFNSDTGDHGSLADSNNVQNNVEKLVQPFVFASSGDNVQAIDIQQIG